MRRWRPFARAWHRWFGILAGLWLLLLALTGSAIVFYDEIDRWLNPDLREVPALAGSPAPIDVAVAQAKAALPGFAPTNILLPTDPRATLWLLGRAPMAGAPQPVQVFTDPRDGRVLGWRASGRVALDRRHAMNLLYALHMDLLAGPWMAWFLGLVGLAWFLDHLIVLRLALPRPARWRGALAIGGRRGSLRRLFDGHRAPGLWLWPATATVALTGVALSWPEASRDLVRRVSPVGDRLNEGWPEIAAPARPVSIERAMQAVTADRTRVHSVRVLPGHAAYAVRTYDPRDRDDQGRLWTYVAMADARVIAARHDNGDSAGDQVFAWQYPLHSGKALGAAGRWLVLAAGLVTIWMVMSGWLLWARRR